jgi:sugar lactone lactonase YvrE
MENILCEVAVNHINTLGEGPVWDTKHKCIIWIDINEAQICRFFPITSKLLTFKLDSIIGSLVIRDKGGYVIACQNGISILDIDAGKITPLVNPEAHLPTNRFNDGKCDPLGRFWVGTMSTIGLSKAGSLYKIEKDHSVITMLDGVSCSNGLAWSKNHKIFYFIDTPTKTVVSFDFDLNKGTISNKKLVYTFSAEDGVPDGMTIDTEGMLWVALWNGWKVVRINPLTNKIIAQVDLPVARVTSCTFGGAGLNDLYITTAKIGLNDEELKKQPLAGSLFVVKNIGFKGFEAHKYQG